MKRLKNLACLTFLFAIVALIACGSAFGQTAPDNYLKMKGKVLDNNTADITVFAENGGNWTQVRTMKSRKSYTLKLNPEENYYVIFESPDGLRKVMHVDGGNTGMWIMYLDIDFDVKNIKYARVHQHSTKGYSFNVVHKDNQRIIIGKTGDTNLNENTEVFSQHTGK